MVKDLKKSLSKLSKDKSYGSCLGLYLSVGNCQHMDSC